jgi:hypothetical protein
MLRFLVVSVRCLDARLIVGDAHGVQSVAISHHVRWAKKTNMCRHLYASCVKALRTRSRQQVAKSHGRGTRATANHREGITVSDLPLAFD